MSYKQINQPRNGAPCGPHWRRVPPAGITLLRQIGPTTLTITAKILIRPLIRGSRPGAERTVSANSFVHLMWQGQSARRPVLPPSEQHRVLSGGLEGLVAGDRANTRKGHP